MKLWEKIVLGGCIAFVAILAVLTMLSFVYAAEIVYYDDDKDTIGVVECVTDSGRTLTYHPTGVDTVDWSYSICDTVTYVREKEDDLEGWLADAIEEIKKEGLSPVVLGIYGDTIYKPAKPRFMFVDTVITKYRDIVHGIYSDTTYKTIFVYEVE